MIDLDVVRWSDLLEHNIAGELASPELGAAVEEIMQLVTIRLERYEARVRVQHGLVIAQDGTNEPCYLIDDDLFTEQQTELNNVGDILNYFNQENGKFFRSAISERLKMALGKQKA